MFLSTKVHANKFVLHFELMIFIRYKNNSYCYIYKEISFSTLYMPSLIRDFFLNVLTPM